MDLAGILRKLKVSGPHALVIIAAAVGLATAGGALGFRVLIGYFNHLFFGLTDQRLMQAFGGGNFKFWLPLIPMAGGFLVGPIVFRFAKEARGHGVPEVMNAVARLGRPAGRYYQTESRSRQGGRIGYLYRLRRIGRS
jgi:chloride channel protein, CIC family